MLYPTFPQTVQTVTGFCLFVIRRRFYALHPSDSTISASMAGFDSILQYTGGPLYPQIKSGGGNQ